jgi:hypothetical protein
MVFSFCRADAKRPATRRRLRLESLERRELLSATMPSEALSRGVAAEGSEVASATPNLALSGLLARQATQDTQEQPMATDDTEPVGISTSNTGLPQITNKYEAMEFFLGSLYHGALGRDLDSAGLQYWTAQLDNGLAPDQVLRGIWASFEYRAMSVEAVYQRYLGRAAEADAVAYWTDFIGAQDETAFHIAILTSAEYRTAAGSDAQYIQSLYADLLNRTADSAEESYWLATLGNADGATQVASGVLNSVESCVRMLEASYVQYHEMIFLSSAAASSEVGGPVATLGSALSTALSGLDTYQSSIDVVANNLANISTTAYKQFRSEFFDDLQDAD